MNGHPIEIRMKILGPNGTQKIFHPPIKEDNNPHDLMGLEDPISPLSWIS